MARKKPKRIAVVACSGGCDTLEHPPKGMNCAQALEAYAQGVIACAYGCLGQGSCAAACKFDAIHMGPYGAAEIDRDKCVGCGQCVKACPRGIVAMVAPEYTVNARCASRDPGPATRKVCATGCIACGICQKNCPAGAIAVVDNHAVIDESLCIVCGMCAVKCPRNTIRDANGIFAPA